MEGDQCVFFDAERFLDAATTKCSADSADLPLVYAKTIEYQDA